MALRLDDALVSEYERLKNERHRLVKEIGSTPHSKSRLLPDKIARVQAIERRMLELQERSSIRLA